MGLKLISTKPSVVIWIIPRRLMGKKDVGPNQEEVKKVNFLSEIWLTSTKSSLCITTVHVVYYINLAMFRIFC